MKIINIYKRPAGKTGWRIDGEKKTLSNKKLLEMFKANELFGNECLIKFVGINENYKLGLNDETIGFVKLKEFTIAEAIEFIQSRIDGKQLMLKVSFEYK